MYCSSLIRLFLIISLCGSQAAQASINSQFASQPAKQTAAAPYQPAHTKVYDLLHTKLEINFDWEKQYLHGIATLQLKVHFYPQKQLILDAQHLIIHQVFYVEADSKHALTYDYDQKNLIIDLERIYTKEEPFLIEIHYTAKASTKVDWLANTKQGIYFINPQLQVPNKPRQIWTQGEPNTASCWFPTIDAPNQKCTQEMYITVEDQYKTLSNGVLVYSTIHEDQTRTDYWRMDLPHAPYLFMLAVGAFAVVQDEWNDVPLSHYVGVAHAAQAQAILGRIPAMLELFSEKLDYPYPWPAYSQVVVQDYPAGGMENTTAVVLSDIFHKDERALLDSSHEHILAHEIFHHWFGNLVTCNSWSQIVLNESLASLGSLLWQATEYGVDEEQLHLWYTLQSYLEEAKHKQTSLFRPYYHAPIEVFDAHSYHKGVLVMQMLKYYIGDEAFWQSLSHYLKKHAFGSADIHQLRKCFEEITGEDLNWFFDQWFFAPGHPLIKAEHQYSGGKLILKIWQKQVQPSPIYRIPLKVDVWVKGIQYSHQICLDKVYQEYKWAVDEQPELVVLDHTNLLVGELEHAKTPLEYQYLYQYGNNFFAKHEALNQLIKNNKNHQAVQDKILWQALEDPYWFFRMMAIEASVSYQEKDGEIANRLIQSVYKDPHSAVRAAALNALSSLQQSSQYVAVYQAGMKDASYQVASAALKAYALHSQDPDKPAILAEWETCDQLAIINTLANYYIATKQADKYPWFKEQVIRLYHQQGYEQLIPLWAHYVNLVGKESEQVDCLHQMQTIAKHSNTAWLQASLYQALKQFPKSKLAKQIIQEMEVVK